MPKIDIDALAWRGGSSYPPHFAVLMKGRERKRLGDAGGLTQFGVNLTRLAPGSMSALRHWHEREDELIYVLQGEIVLVEDEGETLLRPGDCATFKAGTPNGHHLVNKSGAEAVYLEIGSRFDEERVEYPDVDLLYAKAGGAYAFMHKDGTAFDGEQS